MTKILKTKQQPTRTTTPTSSYKDFGKAVDEKRPLLDHIRELRGRLFWIVMSILVGSVAGYAIHDRLLAVVQKPLGEKLYYTSPVGGLNFLIQLCVSFGVIITMPVIFYNLTKFVSPLLKKSQKKYILRYSIYSILLAYTGVLFAYFISLPAALAFLTNFGGENISSLITVNEYYDFALAYLLGFAVLFQLPIIILFINKIKPLKPGGMMRAQRWIIVASFVIAAILTPTPDPINQLIMAMPAIILYQVGIGLVWLANRKSAPQTIKDMKDLPSDLTINNVPDKEVQIESYQPVVIAEPVKQVVVSSDIIEAPKASVRSIDGIRQQRRRGDSPRVIRSHRTLRGFGTANADTSRPKATSAKQIDGIGFYSQNHQLAS